MPGFDGTGPVGAGRMTGLGRGTCSNDSSTDTNVIYGRGLGFRRGMNMYCGTGFGRGCGLGYGRGYGLGFGARVAPSFGTDAENIKESLVRQKDFLKTRMDVIDKRLETL